MQRVLPRSRWDCLKSLRTVSPHPLHSAMPLVGKTDLAEQQREWHPLIPTGPMTSPGWQAVCSHWGKQGKAQGTL